MLESWRFDRSRNPLPATCTALRMSFKRCRAGWISLLSDRMLPAESNGKITAKGATCFYSPSQHQDVQGCGPKMTRELMSIDVGVNVSVPRATSTAKFHWKERACSAAISARIAERDSLGKVGRTLARGLTVCLVVPRREQRSPTKSQ